MTPSSPPDSPTASASPANRRARLVLTGEFPLAIALIGLGAGLLVIANHHFRAGSIMVGTAVVAAAVFRLVLPSRRAGLLVVRSRLFDVTVLAVLGLAILALGLAVPP